MLKALLGAFALVFVANGAIAFDARPAAPSVGIEQTTTKSYISQYGGQTSTQYYLYTNVIPLGKTVIMVYNGNSINAYVAGTITNPIPGVAVQVSAGIKNHYGWGNTHYTAAYTWF